MRYLFLNWYETRIVVIYSLSVSFKQIRFIVTVFTNRSQSFRQPLHSVTGSLGSAGPVVPEHRAVNQPAHPLLPIGDALIGKCINVNICGMKVLRKKKWAKWNWKWGLGLVLLSFPSCSLNFGHRWEYQWARKPVRWSDLSTKSDDDSSS